MRANYFLSFVSLRHFNFRNYFVDNKVIYTKTAANGERTVKTATNELFLWSFNFQLKLSFSVLVKLFLLKIIHLKV